MRILIEMDRCKASRPDRVKLIRDVLSRDLHYDGVNLSYSRKVEIARNIDAVLAHE